MMAGSYLILSFVFEMVRKLALDDIQGGINPSLVMRGKTYEPKGSTLSKATLNLEENL